MRIRRFDLAFDLIPSEQRHRILIKLQLALSIRRHEALHVLLSLLEGLRLIDQAFAHIVREVIAQAAGNRVAFLEYQEGGGAAIIGGDDRVPGRFQVVQIPLQFFSGAPDTGGPHNGPHAVRNLQGVHGFAHLIAVFAFDPPRYTAGAWIVRHEHEESTGQADEGGKCGAFIAALFLLNLHDQFLAFLQQILDIQPAAGRRLRSEVFLGDFLQWQEAVALSAVFDERRFETRLDAGYSAFIDIGFFLFP